MGAVCDKCKTSLDNRESDLNRDYGRPNIPTDQNGEYGPPSISTARSGDYGRPNRFTDRDGDYGRPNISTDRKRDYERPKISTNRNGDNGRPKIYCDRNGDFWRSNRLTDRNGDYGRPSVSSDWNGGFGRPSLSSDRHGDYLRPNISTDRNGNYGESDYGQPSISTYQNGDYWRSKIATDRNGDYWQPKISTNRNGYYEQPSISTDRNADYSISSYRSGNYGRPSISSDRNSDYGRPSISSDRNGDYGRPSISSDRNGDYGRPSISSDRNGDYGRPSISSDRNGDYGRPSISSYRNGDYGRPSISSDRNGDYGRSSISNRGNYQRKPTNGTRSERVGDVNCSISIIADNIVINCHGALPGDNSSKSDTKADDERKSIFNCGFTASSTAQHVPTGNFIDCRNVPVRSSMRDVKKLVTCSGSVCQIRFCNNTATGFRVGSKYIITALHVVKHIVRTMDPRNEVTDFRCRVALLSHRNIYCFFDYLEENNFENVRKYYFEPVIHFANEKTDTAVLELKDNADGNPMPPALDQFGFPEYAGKFTLIGHEGSAMKCNTVDLIIDKDNPTTIEDIRWVKQYNNRKTHENYEFEPYSTLTNERRILFHCQFCKGASGSPGIVVLQNGTFVVVTMLLCGYPNWYYDENVDGQLRSQWPKEYCIEQGADMASVGRIMYSEEPGLYEDIFCRSVPEPAL